MPTERLIIVTEGKIDVLIARTILSRELTTGIRFFAGQGRESLITLGRNLLVHEGEPVLLVMDVTDPELPSRDEIVAEVMRALSAIAPPGTFQVFVFTPEIEIVFFEAPDALQRALGRELSPLDLEEGTAKPKAVLRRLMTAAGIPNTETLIQNMDNQSIKYLAHGKHAQALREMVRSFSHSVNAAGVDV